MTRWRCEPDRGENVVMVVTAGLGVRVQTVREIDPFEALNMRSLVAFEWTQEAPQSCCWNDVAPMNMRLMSPTLDTSHCEISQLNEVAQLNMQFISVTLDTFHTETSPLNDVAL